MSGGTPRKFSEKIAIMERKQNEDVNQFEDIMREVRNITSHDPAPAPGPGPGLQPPSWPQLGGSLPNVAQLPSYTPGGWPQWEQTQRGPRGRSPEQHYHPYRGGQRSPDRYDRVPPLHPHYVQYAPQHHSLLPPENWNQINRARSDPALHQSMVDQMYPQGTNGAMQQHYMQMQPGPSSGVPFGMMPMHPSQAQSQAQAHPSQQQQMAMQQSPIQSPMANTLQGYQFPNGSPMQSPLGSPMGSSLMLDERTTPMMELSPPGMHDPNMEVGSLPNLQQMPPSCYHATVGQRHSTGQCGRLVPGPAVTSESQSAPTSPHNTLDPAQQPQWSATRTFSNSPESLDIPRLVLTNPDGANGPHVECFNDMQHLTLESSMLCNGVEQQRNEPATN